MITFLRSRTPKVKFRIQNSRSGELILRKFTRFFRKSGDAIIVMHLLVQNLTVVGLAGWFSWWQGMQLWQTLLLDFQVLLLMLAFSFGTWFWIKNSCVCGKKLQQQMDEMKRLNADLRSEISERQEVEAKLKAAKASAEKANRAKSEFLANMSHELRTPLNAILGFSELMASDETLARHAADELSIINRSGEYLLKMINDILEISKIESGKVALNPENFDLYELLDSLKEMFVMPTQSKSLKLEFTIDKDVPQYIKTDLGKLRQILINLLSNAIKFTEQGQIILRVGVSYNSHNSLLSSQECKLIFNVVDTGIGIADGEESKLFNPFERTDNSREQEGTGLGLAISRKFIELMGGKIRLKSYLGKGSSFKFSILATIVEASDINEVVESQSAQRVIRLADNQPQYCILVVDDRPSNRTLINKMLSRVGFKVIEAADGAEAIAQWQHHKPQLIFMDMRMPQMSGYEATRRIKSTAGGKNTVIIAITASAFREKKQQIKDAGCDDFIAKPFRAAVAFEKIAQYLKVEYIYEKTSLLTELSTSSSTGSLSPVSLLPLTASAFSGLDKKWLQQFEYVVTIGNLELINWVINSIPSSHQALAIALKNLVDDFRLDTIQDLLSELKL